jgi:hypothetical protein
LTAGLGAHTGQGGPCTPTGKDTTTDYVYVMDFAGDKIRHMTKIWNAGWAMKELGWADVQVHRRGCRRQLHITQRRKHTGV